MRSVLCIFLGVLAVLAVARTRTTQKQLHSSAAIVQTLDITEVDSVDLTDGVDPGGIVMKGYSKRAADSKESFFLTSKLKHRISSVRLLLRYSAMDGVLAWKMPGAGGGGYLALVCRDRDSFPEGAIELEVRS